MEPQQELPTRARETGRQRCIGVAHRASLRVAVAPAVFTLAANDGNMPMTVGVPPRRDAWFSDACTGEPSVERTLFLEPCDRVVDRQLAPLAHRCWATGLVDPMGNLASESPIQLEMVKKSTDLVIPRLDENFFRVRFDRLTPSEKNFLRAMAELGPGDHRTGDVAQALGVKVTSLGPVRAKLIKKGMIYSPAHGDLAFTVPLFDEFMVRAMPVFERKD